MSAFSDPEVNSSQSVQLVNHTVSADPQTSNISPDNSAEAKADIDLSHKSSVETQHAQLASLVDELIETRIETEPDIETFAVQNDTPPSLSSVAESDTSVEGAFGDQAAVIPHLEQPSIANGANSRDVDSFQDLESQQRGEPALLTDEDQISFVLEIQPETSLIMDDALSVTKVPEKKSRPPRKYIPSIRTGETTQTQRTERSVDVQSRRTRPFSMRVRMVFRTRKYQFSLLPERADDSAEELEVIGTNGTELWGAYQDEWYQEVIPNNFGDLLKEGGVWESSDGQLRWVLSGREIYVLAPDLSISGFVQSGGLVLGEQQSVLCVSSQQDEVLNALLKAGCSDPLPIKDKGIPEGWILFTDLRPLLAIEHQNEAGLYNILRPSYDFKIEFVGGIRLNRSTWLVGHPPSIRVLGASDSNIDVFIDGQTARLDAEGSYTASDWDTEGRHVVFSGGISQSYELANGAEDWEFFDAYRYNQNSRVQDAISVCGPAILPAKSDKHLLILPRSNRCLIGALPGDIVVAPPPLIRTPTFLAQSNFDVVWNLPADPLRCDKASSRVRLIRPIAPSPTTHFSDQQHRRAAIRWYQIILDASRKGLRVDPNSEEANKLWLDYKRKARALRKLLR